MSIIELGALGEFLGSIGVIATLIYLAIQIRQNTHSLDEGRRLAMAQSYEARASRVDADMRQMAESPYLGIHERARDEGVGGLTPEEQARVRYRAISYHMRFDNLHYQYEQGCLDDIYYESIFMPGVRRFAPQWKELELGWRPTFRQEIDRILSESEDESEDESEENAQ